MIFYNITNIVARFAQSSFFSTYLLYFIAFYALFVCIKVIFELIDFGKR